MDQGQWSPITNCAMWSHFVVFGPPFFNFLAGVVQIQEPVPTKALEPNRSVEAFHDGIRTLAAGGLEQASRAIG